MKKLALLFSISLFMIISCTNKREKLSNDIKQRESKLFSNGNAYNLKTPEVQGLIDKYILFANTFPEDTSAAEYIYKSADLYIGIKNYTAAAKSYDEVIKLYPSYSKMSYCIFLAGFNAENNLRDYDLAKKYYELFLLKYPKAAMADDVRFSLLNLGKSADDIVKEFEQKNRIKDSLSTL